MKKIILLIAVLTTVVAVKAQDCRALVLPKFNYDTNLVDNYPNDKLNYYCAYARAAFYESDTVPTGVDIYNIGEVIDNRTGESLGNNYIVDLNTLNYFAYNFKSFHMRYRQTTKTIAFATPRSSHPYLIMRSISDMNSIAYNTLKSAPME